MKKMSRNTKLKILALTLASFLVAVAFIFTSCQDLALPTAIEIKANPSLEVPVMAADTSKLGLGDKLTSLLSGLGSSDTFSVYSLKQNSSDDAMRFLLAMKMSQEIDTGTDGFSVTSMLEAFGDAVTIGYEEDGEGGYTDELSTLATMPDFDLDVSIGAMTLDESSFMGGVQSSIELLSSSEVSEFSGEGTTPGLNILLSGGDSKSAEEGYFSSITFGDSGKLTLKFAQTAGTTVKITKIYVAETEAKLTAGTYLGSYKAELDLTSSTESDRTAEIDMTGQTLNESFYVALGYNISGCSSAISLSPKISGLSQINGFTKTELSVDFPAISDISLGTDIEDTFTQAKLGEGSSFNLSMDGIPSGVSYKTFTMTMSQTDTSVTDGGENDFSSGLSVADADVSGGSIDLEGQYLNTNDISMSGTLSVKASNATISVPLTITPSPSLSVSSFDYVVVPQTALGDITSIDPISQAISSDVSDTVSKIYFETGTNSDGGKKGFGLKVAIDNELPLDLTLGIYSSLMKQGTDSENPETATFESGETTTNYFVTQSYYSEGTCLELEGKTLDASISLDLGAIEISSIKYLKMTDVTPGQEFKCGIKVEPVLDVKEAYVILPEENRTISGKFPDVDSDADPIDLSTIGTILGSAIYLKDITTYAYIDDSVMLDSNITAKMLATFTPSDAEEGAEATKLSFIDGATEDSSYKATISFEDVPVLPDVDDDGYIVKDFSSETASFTNTTFQDVLKAAPSDFYLDYEINLSGDEDGLWFDLSELLAESDDDDDDGSGLSVTFALYIDFPIVIAIPANENGYGGINIISLIKSLSSSDTDDDSETDLFGRASDSDSSTLQTLMDYIEKVGISVNYTNNTGMALTIALQDGDLQDDGDYAFDHQFTLANNTTSTTEFSLTTSDFEYIKDTIPFYPDTLEVRLPGSKTEEVRYALKRDLGLSLVLIATVAANVDYTISFGGSN